jgi:hypothetical protein
MLKYKQDALKGKPCFEMEIIINNTTLSFKPLVDFFSQQPDVILRQILFYFGWIPLCFVFLWGAKELWLFYRQEKWAHKNAKYTFLAIDIPRGNEQSPKAVENLFSYLGGAHGTLNLIDTYWEGKFQLSFSFEIISIGGYTQFLIRTPIVNRDLVESAIYAQYPDAEITEVDDYAASYKDLRFPNDKYDIAGAEFVQQNNSAYPIRTYEEFEHQFGEPETTFRDPLAALMDLCSSLKTGEQLWYQMLIIPVTPVWDEVMDKEVAKILKEKPKANNNILNKGADLILSLITSAAGMVVGNTPAEGKEEKKDDSLKMMNLKPKDKKRIEAMQEKEAKMPYKFKIRMVYLAEKDQMNKAKVFGGFVGFIKQFTAVDLNSLKPDMDRTATSTAYFFRDSHLNHKKNRLFHNYIARDSHAGRPPGLMNVEELATLWHFPIESVVKAPLIQKTAGRKAEPPMTLPQAEESIGTEKSEPLFFGELENEDLFIEKKPENIPAKPDVAEESLSAEENFPEAKGLPPSNLPFV